MHPRLLEYYNQELLHIREGAAEFAREFPKIAGRLALAQEAKECPDPYVERLLEGFAYLAARVQLKIDGEYADFTQNLLEMVYPGYLSPVPAMAMVQFSPDLTDPALGKGFTLPRDTVLRTRLIPGERTGCEFRTVQPVTFWPLRIAEVRYHGYAPELPAGARSPVACKAGLRIRLAATAGLSFDQLSLDRLSLTLSGNETIAYRLYEQVLANAVEVMLRPLGKGQQGSASWLGPQAVQGDGFDDAAAMLPGAPRSFAGYRLLREYSAFAARFLSIEIGGLAEALARCATDEVELLILLGKADAGLEQAVDAASLALFCAPAVNLFPKRADRIHLSESSHEFHLVPDRNRPMDFEVYQVKSVTGYGSGVEVVQSFAPLYAVHDEAPPEGTGYYTLRRLPRVLSAQQKLKGPRSSYVGTEVYLSLVDPGEAPYSGEVEQLAVETLCSNRDLPLHLSLGGENDFTLEVGAPVQGIRCVKGPSRPLPPALEGEIPWRLISQLSLNYLSLLDTSPRAGAAALREMLSLYGLDAQSPLRKQLEGVQSVSARQIIRRMPTPGPIAFGRGVEIQLTLDERAFDGGSVFLLGSVLERFFARHASLNSFTETVLHSASRGEIKRWPARLGTRTVL